MAVKIENPVNTDIREEEFVSPADGSHQTYLLAGASGAAAPVPLLAVYLHGGLNHQEQGMTAGIYNDFFGKMWRQLSKRRAVYVCPEYRGNSWMGPAAEADLMHILDMLNGRYHPRKVLLMGGSMGGTSALIFASRHAARLDAAMAMCPATDMAEMHSFLAGSGNADLRGLGADLAASYGGEPREVPHIYRQRSSRYHACQLAGPPLAITHGTADGIIDVHHSRLLVEELKKCGARLLYREIENGDHDSPETQADIDPALNFLLGPAD